MRQGHDGSGSRIHHDGVCAVWLDIGDGCRKFLFGNVLDAAVDGQKKVASIHGKDGADVFRHGKALSSSILQEDIASACGLELRVAEFFNTADAYAVRLADQTDER